MTQSHTTGSDEQMSAPTSKDAFDDWMRKNPDFRFWDAPSIAESAWIGGRKSALSQSPAAEAAAMTDEQILAAIHKVIALHGKRDERALFEAVHIGNKQAARRNEHGDYVLPAIQDAWAGWEARAALSQSPAAEAVAPCNHTYEARPIDGSNSATAPCKAVCKHCGFEPSAAAPNQPAAIEPVAGQAMNGDFIAAVNKLVFMARTSGGTAGRDDDLCKALDAVETHLRSQPSQPVAGAQGDVLIEPPGDNFGSAEHWKEKAQYWAAEAHKLRREVLTTMVPESQLDKAQEALSKWYSGEFSLSAIPEARTYAEAQRLAVTAEWSNGWDSCRKFARENTAALASAQPIEQKPVYEIVEGPDEHRPRVAKQVGELPAIGTKLYAHAGICKQLEQVHKFLLGEESLDHCHFGDRPDGVGGFWWRQHLRDAIAAQNSTDLQPSTTDSDVREGWQLVYLPNGWTDFFERMMSSISPHERELAQECIEFRQALCARPLVPNQSARLPLVLTLDNAPIGTKAPSINGGHWSRVERGWKWCDGDTFPRPGGDWNGKLIPPAATEAGERE